MEEFKKLYKEFRLGTMSLSYSLNKNGNSPFFSREVKRFVDRIVDPMDKAWLLLNESERVEFLSEMGLHALIEGKPA